MKTKTEAKHTPGPWIVSEMPIKVDIFGGDKNIVLPGSIRAGERYGEPIAIMPNGGMKNARLIAAAPELLKAVLAVQEGFKDGSIKWAKPRKSDSDPYHKANTLMCAAISRAEGRA